MPRVVGGESERASGEERRRDRGMERKERREGGESGLTVGRM